MNKKIFFICSLVVYHLSFSRSLLCYILVFLSLSLSESKSLRVKSRIDKMYRFGKANKHSGKKRTCRVRRYLSYCYFSFFFLLLFFLFKRKKKQDEDEQIHAEQENIINLKSKTSTDKIELTMAHPSFVANNRSILLSIMMILIVFTALFSKSPD